MPLALHAQERRLQVEDLMAIDVGEVRKVSSPENGVDMVYVLQPYQDRIFFAFEGRDRSTRHSTRSVTRATKAVGRCCPSPAPTSTCSG